MTQNRVIRSGLLAVATAFATAACVMAAEGEAPKAAAKDGAGAAEAKKTADTAPATYTVKLETTKGDILIDVTREWAPLGADRFYELVKAGYFDDTAFFRVISGFMVQVGISGKPEQNTTWRAKTIKDDPVTKSNTRGMVTFAKTGMPDSRTTQIFINFKDNTNLDKMGFAPFGKVRDMAVVDSLFAEYGEGAPGGKGPEQGRIQKEGNSYLRASFPKLDYIKKAVIVEKEKDK